MADVKIIRDIEYSCPDGDPQLLDLHLPESSAPLPVIMNVHGGAWWEMDKNYGFAQPMANYGYAVASINYRLSREAIFPAQIHDCKASVRWVRSHAKEYNLNPDAIGAWGDSAGGHLVALMGTVGDGVLEASDNWGDVSCRVQAVCDWHGPIDLLQMDSLAPPFSALSHDAPDSPESVLIGAPIQEVPDKAALANPIRYMTPDVPPFLIMHGDLDPAVPVAQSRLFYDALKAAGTDATLEILEGSGHGDKEFRTEKTYRRVVAFFDKHLKAR